MARDEHRRQKALARKRAKRKAAGGGIAAQLRQVSEAAREAILAGRSPVHECMLTQDLFEIGIGNVVVAKKLPGGAIGAGVFLVDIYCLGVKNAFFVSLRPEKFASTIERMLGEDPRDMAPACARKLVEGSVAYAAGLGLKPHRDYRNAKRVFENIDASECAQTFQFGRGGKPYYVSGPNDSPTKSRLLIDRLSRRYGPDGFDYLIPADDDWE